MANVTSQAGGKISGLLALTFEATVALVANDPVHVVGDYQVAKADGSKPIVGSVDVGNVKRAGGVYPSANTPGTCTVEARGIAVRKYKSGAAVAAGIRVGFNNVQKIVAMGAGVAEAGISLMGAGAADVDMDILITTSHGVGA